MRIVVSLLLIALLIFWWVSNRSPSRVGLAEPDILDLHSLEKPTLSAEPSPQGETPQEAEAVEEPRQPVQSLEERGDALLFEIDALQGMPFDQAVVMPFE